MGLDVQYNTTTTSWKSRSHGEVPFAYWADGQPDLAAGHCAVATSVDETFRGLWSTVACDAKVVPMCKLKKSGECKDLYSLV